MKILLLSLALLFAFSTLAQPPAYVPTNGLVVWWGFNGNANDESGNGNNGTVNGATLTTDRFGSANSAYYFSGSSCATRIDANVNTSSINGELTVAIWVLRSGSGCIGPRYFEAWPGSNSVSHFQLSWDNSNAYPQGLTHRVAVNSGGNDFGPTGLSSSTFSAVPNDVWTQIVYINNGANAYIYQDGILKSTGTNPPGSSIQLASDVAIGRMNHPAYDALNGKVDDIGIWNRALSACEVQALYSGQITQPSSGTDVISACDSHQWIDGNTYTASNNTATYTLTNAAGCDSVVTLDLTINNSTTGSATETVCDTYTAPDGAVYTSSGLYTAVISNAANCDSTITIDLTVNNSTTGSTTETACDSYTAPDGMIYTSTGMYTAIVPNSVGCDSTITIALTVNNSTSSTDTQSACDSYQWIDGVTYTSSTNTPTYIIPNSQGCDSTITLDLTVNIVDIQTQPIDQSVYVNSNAQFSVSTSVTNPTYQWQLDNGTGFTNLTNAGQYSGTDTDVLTISNVQIIQNNTLFRCIITDDQNCSATTDAATLTVIDNTGIEELNHQQIFLTPNPTSDFITIEGIENVEDIKSMELVSSAGRIIAELKVGTVKIDVSTLSSGTYFLSITHANGTERKRFVKE